MVWGLKFRPSVLGFGIACLLCGAHACMFGVLGLCTSSVLGYVYGFMVLWLGF
jgi:hypothetical protein